MIELTYDELSDCEQVIADKLVAFDAATAKYLAKEPVELGMPRELTAYCIAEMFSSGKPVKWGAPIDMKTGTAMVTPRTPVDIVRAAFRPPVPPQNVTAMVKRNLLFPSPLNPRKNFDLEYLGQLAESIRKQGILNDLIARPRPGGAPGELEIAAGECRWRASELAKLDELPVKVRDLSDAEMLEIMLVENMKRKDLTTVEECDAFNRAMTQQNPDGSPVYGTIEAFAAKIGEKHHYIRERLALKKLPDAGRMALGCGDISFKTARVVCSLPDMLVAKLLDVVLHPSKFNVWTDGEKRCLTAEEAESYKREHIARELRDTPFQQNDAKLLPVETGADGRRLRGGDCTSCPWNSVNQGTEDSEAQKARGVGRPRGDSKWCHNPECFAKKVEIHTASALVKAKEQGCIILGEEEARKILYDDGEVKETSGFVRLDRKPDEMERNSVVADKAIPVWGNIVKGQATAKVVTGHNAAGDAERSNVEAEVDVPVSVVVTKKGHVVKLVKKSVAVTAAQKLGTAHFLNLSAGGGKSLVNEELADRQRKERAEQKTRNAVSFAAAAALVDRIELEEDMNPELYLWLVEVALWHGANDAQTFVIKRRGLEGKDPAKELLDLAKKGTLGLRLALALEILIARSLKFSGVSEPHFRRLAAIYKVDVAKIEKDIRAESKEKKKPKPKKEKGEKHPASGVIAALKKKGKIK